jgi:DNA-directed RNA polymerase specialized sigma24 family protein
MTATMTRSSDDWSALRARLAQVVRRRVADADVEDVVQTILFVVMTDPRRPQVEPDLQRWVAGVTRHKIADHHRAQRRVPTPEAELDDREAGAGEPPEAKDLLRWATRAAPPGNEETLEWLLREGEGEALESIAAQAQVPAPRVRKRVSRLRAHFRAHWQKELALLAALGLLVLGLGWALRKPRPEPVANDPSVWGPGRIGASSPAEDLRRKATEACIVRDYAGCLRDLDAAKQLDPAGDARPELQQMRREATSALRKTPKAGPTSAPSAAPLPAPSASASELPVPAPSELEPPAPTDRRDEAPLSTFGPRTAKPDGLPRMNQK